MVPRVSPPSEAVRPWHRKPSVWTAAAVFLVSTAAHFRVPLLPEMGQTLEMDASMLGVFVALFAVGRLLVDLPAGALLDRVGPGPMFVLSGLLLCASGALVAVAWIPAVALGGAVLLGIASAGGNTTGQTFFTRNVEDERRGRSLASYSAALLCGQTAGPALAGAAASFAGWRLAMLLASGLGALVALGGWRALRAGPAVGDDGGGSPVPVEDKEAWDADAGTVASAVGLTARQRVALYGARFSGLFVIGAIPQTLVPIIGADNLQLGVGVVGAALGLGGAARFAAAFLGGQLSDRFRRKAVLVSGMCAQALGIAFLLLEGAVWAWVTAIVLVSLGSFAMVTGTAILGDHLPARRAGKELGVYRFIGDLGLLLGPAAGAIVFDVAGQRAAVSVVALLVALSAVAAGLLLPAGSRPAESG